jgi:hypothetical protein
MLLYSTVHVWAYLFFSVLPSSAAPLPVRPYQVIPFGGVILRGLIPNSIVLSCFVYNSPSQLYRTLRIEENAEKMTVPTIRSRIDLLRLSKLLPEELLQPARRKRPEIYHRWTEEERNLIIYLRLHRDWTWGEIHRTFFSSVSVAAVRKAYLRMTPEARMHRASILVSLIANSRNTSGVSWNTHHSTLMHLYTGQKPYQPSQPAPSLSQTKSTGETVASSTPTTGDMNGSTNNGDSRSRYRLRQKRPADFHKSRLQYSVDHQRFAHLSRACEKHHELLKAPDEDHEPPSHSPTPTLSDCSSLIISSKVNDASSVYSNESEYFSAEELHHGLHCEFEHSL